MVQIHGIALLAACYLIGQGIGKLLGRWLNINSNVGGVGFAMLLLIIVHERMHRHKLISPDMEKGILFWSNLYIPVIVAMSSVQNVNATTSAGVIALLAGVLPVTLCVIMLPVMRRIGDKRRQ